MRSLDQSRPTSGLAVGFGERFHVQIPQGTLLPAIDMGQEEFSPTIGVSEMSEITLGGSDLYNFYPDTARASLPERVPATVILLSGMKGGKRRLIFEQQGLKAEEINQVIKLVVELELLDEYNDFSEKAAESVKILMTDLSYNIGHYNSTKIANPTIFPEDSSNGVATSEVKPQQAIEHQLASLGLVVDQLRQAIPELGDKVDAIIRELDKLNVLVFEHVVGNDRAMWWPVKKFMAKPYKKVETLL